MNIRPATVKDISHLLPFLHQLFAIEADFSFDSVKASAALKLIIESRTATVLLAIEQGVICGMVSGQLTISTAEGGWSLLVEDLVVLEAYRSHGFATALLDALADWAKGQGATRMQLLADRTNVPALDFYAKRNWKTTQLICLRHLPS